MQMQQPFESWSLSSPPVPPRSQLYSLQPVGVGTGMVESLTGYVARLLSDLANPKGGIVTPGPRLPESAGMGSALAAMRSTALRTAPPRVWTLLRPRRPAEIYDASLSFRSAMHFQTTYFANAGRGVCRVSTNGARTERSYMSRFSGQSRWHHIAPSTPDHSVAFAAIVHIASAHSACSPGQDTARSATAGWGNRILIANRRAPVRQPLENSCGGASR